MFLGIFNDFPSNDPKIKAAMMQLNDRFRRVFAADKSDPGGISLELFEAIYGEMAGSYNFCLCFKAPYGRIIELAGFDSVNQIQEFCLAPSAAIKLVGKYYEHFGKIIFPNEFTYHELEQIKRIKRVAARNYPSARLSFYKHGSEIIITDYLNKPYYVISTNNFSLIDHKRLRFNKVNREINCSFL